MEWDWRWAVSLNVIRCYIRPITIKTEKYCIVLVHLDFMYLKISFYLIIVVYTSSTMLFFTTLTYKIRWITLSQTSACKIQQINKHLTLILEVIVLKNVLMITPTHLHTDVCGSCGHETKVLDESNIRIFPTKQNNGWFQPFNKSSPCCRKCSCSV